MVNSEQVPAAALLFSDWAATSAGSLTANTVTTVAVLAAAARLAP
jgi:hypothetical protein